MKSVKNYVYTERAHFMCPNMHFGIMAKIESNYDERQLRQSVDTLQKAHPFLQSLIAEETDTGRLYYQIQDCLNIPVLVKDEVALWQQDYEEISVRGWNVKKECLLGKIESNIIAEANFIPPASPANKKTWGVLTVNNHMKICTSNLITER